MSVQPRLLHGLRGPRRVQWLQKAPVSSQARARPSKYTRKIDDEGPYYVLSPKQRAQTAGSDFFEITDLLLDLDAWESKAVRPVNEADEDRMLKSWHTMPVLSAAIATAKVFEDQVNLSRQKVYETTTQPTNIWRLTSHDLLTTALRSHLHTLDDESKSLIKTLRHENGIPTHASAQDDSLMRWTMLRYNGQRYVNTESPLAPTTDEFVKAVRQQDSIVGLRRLVFRCLAAGLDVSSFRPHDKPVDRRKSASQGGHDLSLEILESCVSILKSTNYARSTVVDVLTMLENLSIRLSQSGFGIGAPLASLAAKLGSEI
ncbi:hypothetical protein B0I35DRAFT_404365 [Stachybotrys elegans]|uniref:Uncharacterized protein n=1 Tax=Stachybotrys elegans TaxID=80388 RepID=A0A8K0T855_9HYPO|nr:hypothetical protein B0I35DRAFT_404365 [Stachybotrys elegans]